VLSRRDSKLLSGAAAGHDDRRNRRPAIQAGGHPRGEYVWTNWGTRGLFIGGASDNRISPTKRRDVEHGSLSQSLRFHQGPAWLERAQAAADYAETWIWIWNLRMPMDADDEQLHWKKGVPTIGFKASRPASPARG